MLTIRKSSFFLLLKQNFNIVKKLFPPLLVHQWTASLDGPGGKRGVGDGLSLTFSLLVLISARWKVEKGKGGLSPRPPSRVLRSPLAPPPTPVSHSVPLTL